MHQSLGHIRMTLLHLMFGEFHMSVRFVYLMFSVATIRHLTVDRSFIVLDS